MIFVLLSSTYFIPYRDITSGAADNDAGVAMQWF